MAILDVGCGSKKEIGAIGMDIYPYEGVDIVHDMQEFPWPVEENSFDHIICSHIIEHIEDTALFMKEIHRVAKPQAKVSITTPHFSSVNSWSDPTHKKHFSLQWYKVLTEGYLAAQTGQFSLLNSEVSFGKSLRAQLGRLVYKLRGAEKWEKNCAFIYPGSDIFTELKIIK